MAFTARNNPIKEIVTPDRTYLPEDNVLLYMVEGAMANQYLRDLSTNVKRGMQSKVERGLYPALAPYGYLNKGKCKGSKYIVPDPLNFPKLQALWDLLKTERYNLADLHRIMENKYPLIKKGKPVSLSTFLRIFRNPFYCGLFRWGGKQHIGGHQAMVTQGEFEKIQVHLNKKNHKTRQCDLYFDYKGVFKCGNCGSMITAERKQKFIKSEGRHKAFDYYRCNHHRRHIPCKEKPLSKTKIDDFLLQEIEKIHLPQVIIKFGIDDLKMKDLKESSFDMESIKSLDREKHVLEKQQKMIEINIATEPDAEIRIIMKERLTEVKIEVQRLEGEKKKLKGQSQKQNEELRSQLEILRRAKSILKSDDFWQKKELMYALGQNWELKGKKPHYEPHYVCKAILELKESMTAELGTIEPQKSRSMSGQAVPNECVNVIWGALCQRISNHFL